MVAASRAPYLMLCDQDDVWLDDKVDVTLAAMRDLERSPGVGAVDQGAQVRDEVGPDGRVPFALLGVVTHDEPLGPRPVVAVAVPGADARDGIVERGWSGHDARDRAPIRRPLRAARLPVSLRSAVPLPRPSAYGRATVPQSSGAVTRAVPVTVGVTSVTRTRSPGSAMRTSALTSTVPPGGTVTHSTSTG